MQPTTITATEQPGLTRTPVYRARRRQVRTAPYLLRYDAKPSAVPAACPRPIAPDPFRYSPVNAVLPPARGLDAPGFTERRAESGPAVPETQKYKSKSTPTWKAALWSPRSILLPDSEAPSSLQDGPLGIRQPHRLSPTQGFCKSKSARPGSLRGPRAAVTAIRECAAALGDCLPAFPPFK